MSGQSNADSLPISDSEESESRSGDRSGSIINSSRASRLDTLSAGAIGIGVIYVTICSIALFLLTLYNEDDPIWFLKTSIFYIGLFFVGCGIYSIYLGRRIKAPNPPQLSDLRNLSWLYLILIASVTLSVLYDLDLDNLGRWDLFLLFWIALHIAVFVIGLREYWSLRMLSNEGVEIQ